MFHLSSSSLKKSVACKVKLLLITWHVNQSFGIFSSFDTYFWPLARICCPTIKSRTFMSWQDHVGFIITRRKFPLMLAITHCVSTVMVHAYGILSVIFVLLVFQSHVCILYNVTINTVYHNLLRKDLSVLYFTALQSISYITFM